MKQYPMMESRAGKIAFGVFLFAMLLLARDTLITSTLLGFNKSQFLMLGLICVLGLTFLIRNRKEWKQILLDKRMLAVGFFAVVMLLPMLVKRDWQMMYFSILICLFFAVFLTYFTSCREVAKHYVVSMVILGVYSLFAMYVLKDLANAGSIAPPIFYNSAGAEFYNFGLAFVVPHPLWHRSFGIFREPGVYQFFVILGLYLNHYEVEWGRKWQLWLVDLVLAAVMVSTFAIGGFIEMGMFVLFLYFDQKWYREKWGKILAVAAITAVIAVAAHIISEIRTPYFEFTIYYEFYDMFVRLTTDSNSLVDRLSAIFTDVRFFAENPLFGAGIAEVLHGTNHNTSSTLILYAIAGIAGGTLNVAAWIALLWKKERNIFGNLILLGILFLSFNTQNLVADVFFWLFPCMALVERVLPKVNLPARKV